MKNKVIVIFVIFVFVSSVLVFSKKDNANQPDFAYQKEKVRIAVCPTCYETARRLDAEEYQVILTASTAESLSLLKNNQVDMILSGRTLKPSEPDMNFILIEDGFSFLSSQEISISLGELNSYVVYTDLDSELLKRYFSIKTIQKVDDVYMYLNHGIAITSWENTDYSRAKIVHVFEESGERVKLSRRPTIYCPAICGEEAEKIAFMLNKN